MVSAPRLLLAFIPLVCFFLSRVQGTNDVCTSDGVCLGDEASSRLGEPLFVTTRALTCPANDCDGTGVLEHHLEDENTGGSAGCVTNGGAATQRNGFLRCFKGSDCAALRNIDSVSFRVQQLQNTGSLSAVVNLYKGTSTGCDSTSNVGILYNQPAVASEVVNLSSGTDFFVNVPITSPVTLSTSESLLVGVQVPSLAGDGGLFFVADSNDLDQCDPSYLQSDDCTLVNNPLPVTELPPPASDPTRFASVSYVISVNTSPAATPAPTEPPAPTAAPIPTCIDTIQALLLCIFDYLFGWLLPF